MPYRSEARLPIHVVKQEPYCPQGQSTQTLKGVPLFGRFCPVAMQLESDHNGNDIPLKFGADIEVVTAEPPWLANKGES